MLEAKGHSRGNCRAVAVVGQRYTFLATGRETGGTFALFQADIPAEAPGPPPHTHHREDESFYVLEGAITFTIDGREVVAGKGDFLFALRGVRHTFRNTGPMVARVLIQVTPSGMEDFFSEVGEDWTGREDMPPPPTRDQVQKIIEAAPRYGLEIHVPGSGPNQLA